MLNVDKNSHLIIFYQIYISFGVYYIPERSGTVSDTLSESTTKLQLVSILLFLMNLIIMENAGKVGIYFWQAHTHP